MESDLSIQWKEHQARVAGFLGWSRGALYGEDAWTDRQQFELDGYTASGYRRVIWTPEIPGVCPAGYDWSWGRPVLTLTFPTGASSVALPDDYGGIEGQVTMQPANGQSWWPVDVTGEGVVRQKYATAPTTTGRPVCAAIRPLKGTSPTAGQRFELFVWPLADQDYTFQFEYYFNPSALSASFPYALGGPALSEVLLESCLAVAEGRGDDQKPGEGPHAILFREALASAIAQDRRNKPELFGYNADRSDSRYEGRYPNRPDYQQGRVTFNGTQY